MAYMMPKGMAMAPGEDSSPSALAKVDYSQMQLANLPAAAASAPTSSLCPVMPRVTPVAPMLGSLTAGPSPTERVLAVLGEEALSPGPLGSEYPLTFRVVINKMGSSGLGINITSSIGTGWMKKGLFIANVFDDGLISEWNAKSKEPHCVRPGDFIYQVNGIHTDTAAMIAELREQQWLALYVLRSASGLPLLEVPAPEQQWQRSQPSAGASVSGLSAMAPLPIVTADCMLPVSQLGEEVRPEHATS